MVFFCLQKTLPVLVVVVARLGGAFGEAGLLVLPCIATHLTQVNTHQVLVFSQEFEGDGTSSYSRLSIWIYQICLSRSFALIPCHAV